MEKGSQKVMGKSEKSRQYTCRLVSRPKQLVINDLLKSNAKLRKAEAKVLPAIKD